MSVAYDLLPSGRGRPRPHVRGSRRPHAHVRAAAARAASGSARRSVGVHPKCRLRAILLDDGEATRRTPDSAAPPRVLCWTRQIHRSTHADSTASRRSAMSLAHWLTPTCLAALSLAACVSTPSPVPVIAPAGDVAALVGEWRGEYSGSSG